jgi:hypothetical protein
VRVRSRWAFALAAAAAVAACSGSGGHHLGALAGSRKATTTTDSSTTTAPTTTTAASAPRWPLTGMPLTDPVGARRPALIVKIDNAPRARPQIGLLQADIVVEEQVEGGVTRFAAIFQSQVAGLLGPVRSARSTDIALVADLNHPLFAYSGANARFLQLVHNAPLIDVGYDAAPAIYGRNYQRPSPYNLFTTGAALFARAPAGASAPGPLLNYRSVGQPPADPGQAPAAHALIHFSGFAAPSVGYDWDPARGLWLRSQDGQPHLMVGGGQIAPANVIIQFITYIPTGLVDQAHTPVYQGQLIGSGAAWILTGGTVVKGHWTRANAAAVTTYTDALGNPVLLTPGQTWIELPAIGTPVTATP